MTENNEFKKKEYWDCFIEYLSNRKVYKRLTKRRLKKAKDGLWFDSFFWDDILIRHNGLDLKPCEMKHKNHENYNHMIGNMIGMVYEFLVRNKEKM